MRACLDASGEVLTEMGVFARARALQRHSIDAQADALESLFEAALPER